MACAVRSVGGAERGQVGFHTPVLLMSATPRPAGAIAIFSRRDEIAADEGVVTAGSAKRAADARALHRHAAHGAPAGPADAGGVQCHSVPMREVEPAFAIRQPCLGQVGTDV